MTMITRLAGSVESYAHKAAKATLVGWFRDAAAGSRDDYVQPCGISWRVNRGRPHWGVWEEYPIGPSGAELECGWVWDENEWWIDLAAKRYHGGNEKYAHALLNAGKETFNGYWNGWCPGRIEMRTHTQYAESYWPPGAEPPDYPIPTYAELIELGRPPKAIVDVAIQHKGSIIYAFEVVHKNGLTPEKREFLARLSSGCTFYVIRADWILSQVCCPRRLKFEEVIDFDYAGLSAEA